MTELKLNSAQKAAKERLETLLSDQVTADRQYDGLTQTHGGRIISTDLARFLDTRYRDVPEGRPRDLAPSWDLAWRYAHARFSRELASRGKRKLVRFMAGGWGAGKTHALEHAPVPDLTWDGTLQDIHWAKRMIDLALSKAWHVEVAYVYRDIELAIYGAVERAKSEGRSVPLHELPHVHHSVQTTIRALIKQYQGQVNFALLHNTGAKNVVGQTLIFAENQLAPGGALRYPKLHEDYYSDVARKIAALNPA